MSHTVMIYSYDENTDSYARESERYYIVHEIVTNSDEDYTGDPYGTWRPSMTTRKFFEDEETGMVVRNVEAYEKWLETITPKQPKISEQQCGDWPDSCNCDNPDTHDGH